MSTESTTPKGKKASAAEERLLPGEVIIESAVIHMGIFWRAAAVFIFAVLFTLLTQIVQLGMLLGVVAVLMAIYAIIKKEILMLVVTNKRVLARYGILQVDVVDMHFDKLESMELERMLPGYIMGYSNVVLMGTGNRFIVIPYVANGIALRRAYNEAVLVKDKATA